MNFDMLLYVIQQAIVSVYLLINFLNSFQFMLKVLLQACFVSLRNTVCNSFIKLSQCNKI